jgi:hypothetical protein
MSVRAILLLAVATVLSVGIGHADEAATIPSRKASVVMPLLKQISPSDLPQNVQYKITQILGKPDLGPVGEGPQHHFTTGAYYWLDDKTTVIVGTLNGRFSGVSVRLPGQEFVVLYRAPKS